MNDCKIQALLEFSSFFDPDPRQVYGRIVRTVANMYAGTAMVNLSDGERLLYHLVVSDIPALEALTSLPLDDTY